MSLQHISTSLMVLLAISLSACVRRDGRNPNCEWPAEPVARSLNPSGPADARHLRKDIEFAEELAIEYMDARHWQRSGNLQPLSANQTLHACLTSLAAQIGKSHNVPPRELAQFFGRRSRAVDLAINLPFLVLYWLLAVFLITWLLSRYPLTEGWTSTLVMLVLASLLFTVGGMLIGPQWSLAAENLRVGTGHLSYRVDRLPLVRHQLAFIVLCFIIFWTAAATRVWRWRNKN